VAQSLVGPLAGVVAAVLAAGTGGCSLDPGMPLIPTPSPPATVLPADVPPVRPDGYPNILADPARMPGLPRPAAAVEADVASVAARGRGAEAAAASISAGAAAAELARRGRTHVEETRRAIEAGARPRSDAPPRLSDLPPAAVPVAADPGRPITADDPLPRPVGPAPFLGNEVAREAGEQ